MKDKLIEDIKASIKEYELYHNYITSHFDLVKTRTDRVRVGSANLKRIAACTRIILLCDILFTYFGEDFPLSPELIKEKEDYATMLKSVSIVNGEIKYSGELDSYVAEMEKQLTRTNGN